MTSSIRIGGLPDIDPVLRLWVRAGAQPSRTDDAGGLRALIEHQGSVLLVAEDGALLVGSVIAGWDGWRGIGLPVGRGPHPPATWPGGSTGRRS